MQVAEMINKKYIIICDDGKWEVAPGAPKEVAQIVNDHNDRLCGSKNELSQDIDDFLYRLRNGLISRKG